MNQPEFGVHSQVIVGDIAVINCIHNWKKISVKKNQYPLRTTDEPRRTISLIKQKGLYNLITILSR